MNKQSCGIVFIAISLVLDGRHSLRDLQNRVGQVQCRIQYLIKYKLVETFNLDFYTIMIYFTVFKVVHVYCHGLLHVHQLFFSISWWDKKTHQVLAVRNRMLCWLVRCGGLELTIVVEQGVFEIKKYTSLKKSESFLSFQLPWKILK